MPKSRRRKKKPQKKAMTVRSSSLELRPLPRLAPDQYRAFLEAAIAHGREQVTAFPQTIAEIDKILRNIHPPLLMAVIANYGLQGFVTKNGLIQQSISKAHFSQHHVELLQALALRVPRKEWGSGILVSHSVEPTIDALTAATEAFAARRFASLEKADTEEKKLLLNLQERLRLHTQVVRNWGSFRQVVEHATRLYSVLDGKLKSEIGMSASELIRLFERFVKRIETQSNDRMSMLAKVLKKERGPQKMIEAWYEFNPHFNGLAADAIAALPPNATRANVMALIFSHSDLNLENFYSLSIEEAALLAECQASDAKRALDRLVQDLDASSDGPVEHIFLDNPVWSKPLLRTSTDTYFSAVPQAFFSHVHRIFARLCSEAGLEKDLAARRAVFLEEGLHRAVVTALPRATVKSNLKWKAGGEQFETDTVALIDRTLLIFEAKSGSISDPALRGAPDRAKRHVQELIEAPSIQSARLASLVKEAQGGDAVAQGSLRDLGLWPIDVERFVRTTITLEDFSVLFSAEGDLKRARWTDPSSELAPAMTLTDFEVVGEILGYEACKVHYLQERARLQKRFDVFADELDWLGLYLRTAFAFAATESDEIGGLVLTGLSRPIDDYVNAKEYGGKIPKPHVEMTPFWRGMLDEIAKRRFPGWIEASIALLRAASPSEQRQLVPKFRKLMRRVPATWKKPERKNALRITPRYEGAIAVVLFAYPSLDISGQRAEAQAFARRSFAESGLETCLTIGFDANKPDAPFEYIAFIGFGERAQRMNRDGEIEQSTSSGTN